MDSGVGSRPAEVALGHDEVGDHPPGLADVDLVRPVAVVVELVLGQPVAGRLLADVLGHAGVVGEEVHQPLLILLVLLR